MEIPESQVIAAIAAGGGAIYWVMKNISSVFLASYERQSIQIERNQSLLLNTLVDNKVAMQEVVRLSSEHNQATLHAMEKLSQSQQNIVRSLESMTSILGSLSRNGATPSEESDSSSRPGTENNEKTSDLSNDRTNFPHDKRD